MVSRAFLWRSPRTAGRLPDFLGINFLQLPSISTFLSEKVSASRQESDGRLSQTWPGDDQERLSIQSNFSGCSPEQRQQSSQESITSSAEYSEHASSAFGHLFSKDGAPNFQRQLSGFTLPFAQATDQRRELALPLSSSLFSTSVAAQAPLSNSHFELTNHLANRNLYSLASSGGNAVQYTSHPSAPGLNSRSLLSERLSRDNLGICVQHMSTDGRTTATKPLEKESLSKVQESKETKRLEVQSGQGWSSWTKDEAFNLPNAISMARLISGPAIGGLIVAGHHKAALGALIIAGASDWLDGYVAKHYNIVSTLGTYLDPLADKVLMGSVAAALAWEGTLPDFLLVDGDRAVWLVSLVVARDVALIGAAALHRGRTLGWKWNGWSSYFQLGKGGAPKVRPLFISKANTVFQLALVGCALTYSAYGIPAQDGVNALCYMVGTTTLLSWLGYFVVYLRNPARLVE